MTVCMSAVVRFDAELLVHLAAEPMACAAAVVTREKPWPDAHVDVGSTSTVRRCVLPDGHDGDHTATDRRHVAIATLCGLLLTDNAWINWTTADSDPRCPDCYGVAVDEQEVLL